MRYLLTVVLLAALLAGCSAASSMENITQTASPTGNRVIVNPTMIPTAEATMQETTSVSKPRIIKVRPPMIPIGPVQGTPAFPVPTLGPLQGWQTFTSAALGVAVDYPMDWAVTENNPGVSFTSPQGSTILLKVGNSNSSSSTPGQDCATLINAYGQTGEVCFDAATFSYSAVFKKTAGESTAWLTLSVMSREKPDVFLQMVDSLRPVP
jgi:hypothetical protein